MFKYPHTYENKQLYIDNNDSIILSFPIHVIQMKRFQNYDVNVNKELIR